MDLSAFRGCVQEMEIQRRRGFQRLCAQVSMKQTILQDPCTERAETLQQKRHRGRMRRGENWGALDALLIRNLISNRKNVTICHVWHSSMQFYIILYMLTGLCKRRAWNMLSSGSGMTSLKAQGLHNLAVALDSGSSNATKMRNPTSPIR